MLGAGLFAANLSTTFRLRQFGMADKVPYSVAIQLQGEAGEHSLLAMSSAEAALAQQGQVASCPRATAPCRRRAACSPQDAGPGPQEDAHQARRAPAQPHRRLAGIHAAFRQWRGWVAALWERAAGRSVAPAVGSSLSLIPSGIYGDFNHLCWLDPCAGAWPCCRRAFQLGAFEVSGIQSVAAKYNESGKLGAAPAWALSFGCFAHCLPGRPHTTGHHEGAPEGQHDVMLASTAVGLVPLPQHRADAWLAPSASHVLQARSACTLVWTRAACFTWTKRVGVGAEPSRAALQADGLVKETEGGSPPSHHMRRQPLLPAFGAACGVTVPAICVPMACNTLRISAPRSQHAAVPSPATSFGCRRNG